MSVCRSLAVFVAMWSAVLVCADRTLAQIPDVPGWEITFHDEFDGTSLDTVKWEALDRRDSFNNEKQYYHPNQVAVADGYCKSPRLTNRARARRINRG